MTVGKLRVKRGLLPALTAAFLAAAALLVFALGPAPERPAPVGHGGGPLLGPLYAAAEEEGFSDAFAPEKFGSSSDVGYALLSGKLDMGFIEPAKLDALHAMDGYGELTAVGRITFPYGATLVVRKGLNLRLGELGGRAIGVSSPECKLYHAFLQDAARLGADLSGTSYVTMPFDAMLPALEAGVVDAVVTKGAYAAAAQRYGHAVLYQNWDMAPGDECCPAIVDQVELVLLARKSAADRAEILVQKLTEAAQLEPSRLRGAIARALSVSAGALEGLPVSEFSPANDALVELMLGHEH